MKESKLIDSSVWLAYLFNGSHKELIESGEMLLISSLSLFEIKKKLMKSRIDDGKIAKSMEFVKKRSLIVPVTDSIAEKAVEFSLEYELPIIDSLIYSSGILNESTLITLDNDFRGLKQVNIL